MNLYGYAASNPVNYTDPDGLCFDTIWDILNLAYDAWTGQWDDFAFDLVAATVPFIPAGASKALKAAEAAKSVMPEAIQGFRYVGEAEASIIQQTGKIPLTDRFGNPKNLFYTNEKFTSGVEAQRVLSLDSTPAFRAEFDIRNAPAGYGGLTDGFGAELILKQGAGPIPTKAIVPLE